MSKSDQGPRFLEIPVTFLPNVRNPSRFETIPLKRALGQIKKGTYKEQVESAQSELLLGDDGEYKRKKNALPSYAFHGTFEGKVVNANLKNASGLVHGDVDGLSLEKLIAIRERLISDPTVAFVFKSPSGNGLKFAVRVNPDVITDDSTFKIAFAKVEDYWATKGVTLDTSCKDVRRVCFTSYDPDLYYNVAPTLFPLEIAAPKLEAVSEELPVEGYTPITEDYILPDVTLANAASFLPPAGEQNYAEWRDVGAALHHQFSGSKEGLAIFDQWSQNVREYQGSDDVEKQWNAFGKRSSGKVVTFKTLMQAYYKRITPVIDLSSVKKAHRLLEECEDYMTLTSIIAPKLWKLADKNVILEKDFQALLIARYSELRPDDTLSKPEALRAMKTKREKKTPRAAASFDIDNEKTPSWAKGWVWVSGDEKFFNVETRITLSSLGFRGHYNSCLPMGDDAPKDAAEHLRVNNLIPKVMKTLYAPNFDTLFTYSGVEYVNTYNNKYRATVPDTVVNQHYVDTFKLHLSNLCGEWNREAHLLANFLAYCTAERPLKVRWAPLLIGTPGNGKSLLHTFVSSAIGIEHTKAVPNSVIANSATSGQSGWAEGHCFGVIEEVKMHGHNRYDIFNNLKPYITNDVVPCRKLYEEVRNIPNTANWMAFSNYQGGAPIEDGDRRYFVIISEFKPKEGSAREQYFKVLHEAISKGAGDIVRWLRDLPLHADFNPEGHAPMTEDKKTVIRLTGDDLPERILEVMEDDNDPYYGPSVVLFDSLFVRLAGGFPGLKLDSPYKLTTTLAAMGFSNLGRIRIEGGRHSIWCRRTDGAPPTQKWGKQIIENRIANKAEDLL